MPGSVVHTQTRQGLPVTPTPAGAAGRRPPRPWGAGAGAPSTSRGDPSGAAWHAHRASLYCSSQHGPTVTRGKGTGCCRADHGAAHSPWALPTAGPESHSVCPHAEGAQQTRPLSSVGVRGNCPAAPHSPAGAPSLTEVSAPRPQEDGCSDARGSPQGQGLWASVSACGQAHGGERAAATLPCDMPCPGLVAVVADRSGSAPLHTLVCVLGTGAGGGGSGARRVPTGSSKTSGWWGGS